MRTPHKNIPPGFEPVSHPDVRHVVGNLHVSKSCLAVCRAVKAKLGKRKWRKLEPLARRYAIAAAIQAHAHNKLEYRAVMSGSLSLLSRFRPRYYFSRDTQSTIIVIKP